MKNIKYVFFLKGNKKERESGKPLRIYIRISFNNSVLIGGKKIYQNLEYSTGEILNPAYWNNEQRRPASGMVHKFGMKLIQNLNEIESKLSLIIDEYKLKEEKLIPSILKFELDKSLNRITEKIPVKQYNQEANIFISDFINNFIKNIEDNPIPTVVDGTLRQYRAFLNRIKRYETHLKTRLLWRTLTDNEYKYFYGFMNDEYRLETGKDYTSNFLWVQRKLWLKFIGEAQRSGHVCPINPKNKEYQIQYSSPDKEFLTLSELKKIAKLRIKDDNGIQVCRDMFIVQSLTGVRWSDLRTLLQQKPIKMPNESNKYYFSIYSQKTDLNICLPCFKPVLAIFKKYSSGFPLIAEQNYNMYLKKICRLAKMQTEVVLKVIRNGKIETEKSCRCDLISSHTARRSFITNSLLFVAPSVVELITHRRRSRGVFQTYNKASQLMNLELFYQLFEKGKEVDWLFSKD